MLNTFKTISILSSRTNYFSKCYFSSTGVMNFKTIGTHNGTFHCDEVLGCFLLKILSKDATIVRSRDNKILDKCDIVIDVGGVFDLSKNRFDHHQRSFSESMNSLRPEKPYKIKLSSAGLVYCYFGEEILKRLVKGIDEKSLGPIYDKVYEKFVQEVDGIDNGVPMFEGEPKYNIHTNLSSRVQKFNRNWNDAGEFDEEKAFNSAMELVGKEFTDVVSYVSKVWWPARIEVLESIKKRYEVDQGGEIIQLERFVPWIDHLFQIESDLKLEPMIKFVIYPEGNSNWRVRSVPVSHDSFVLRNPLFKEWRGLRDDSFLNAPVDGIKFVHASGFIGGNTTRDGAVKMAVFSLNKDS